jgi:TRAP transporter TAXI family solute receptor
MPYFGRRALLVSLPAAAAAMTARAEAKRITLGSAVIGGGMEVYGVALVDAIHSVDPTFEIRAVTTKGIQDNVARLEDGTLDIAMVFGELVHELFAGVGRPPTKLRIISAMYSTPGMFVVRSDSRFRAINDLTGHRVVWNGLNSGLAVQARYVLEGLGLDPDKDFDPVYIERLQDGPQMVIDGSAAALWGSGKRWPGFVTVSTNSRGARFVAPNKDEIARIRQKHPFLAEFVVPAGQYSGQYDAITTVGSWAFILARADLDDAIGYRLAQALNRSERMSLLSKQLSETTVKNTLMAVPERQRLQPGVLQYYEKAGLLP